ncbi:MAG: hydrogenase formation protein HypD, partial [Bacteroidales bacterium]
KIVFAAIGFETTVPGTAIAILKAEQEQLNNFFIISAHKIMPPPMSALIEEGIQIDGYIGPGHVSTVAGSKIFSSLVAKHNIPIVISGFEPVDLLQSVLFLTQMINAGKSGVKIQYSRLVSEEGNLRAQKMISGIFDECDTYWRGIGLIPGSGLCLNRKYDSFNAETQIPVEAESGPEPKGCLCGKILKGLNKPTDCPLFGKKCTPSNPVGACMVSSEGACQAYYNFQETE